MKKILFVLAILITSVVNVNAQLSKDVKVIKISNGVHDYLTTVVNAIPITQESKIKASSSVIIDYNKFKTNTDIETLLHHLDTLLPSLDDIEKKKLVAA